MEPRKRIGVLALQGDYEAHIKSIVAAGGEGFEVRTPGELATADALILPGGESTTIGYLLARFGLDKAIQAFQKPIWGTCAGMILLAKRITEGEKRGGQPLLGLLDISVARNAFGRQTDSFEARIETSFGPVTGVFIRAPYVSEWGPSVEVLGRYEDRVVLVRQGNILASAFHPELTEDPSLHRAFIERA
ncbi:pyridoxal 5'-phosphate synthase glutaminase subunit PdxT [Armatimonas sp.]|uniref:pyridoxal 5'-phosphate synthase glutaminase subunit PdxT n=1 Tax=Armatimonas sp. TaxID=1872638 RepID=UPI0037534664